MALALAAPAQSQVQAPDRVGDSKPPTVPTELSPRWGVDYIFDLGRFELLKLNQEEWARPFIHRAGTLMFLALRSNRLEAREIASGEVRWSYRDFATLGAAMGEWSGLLLVGADSDLVGMDQQTGSTRWKVDLDAAVAGPMEVQGNIAFIPVRPNGVVAVDLATETLLWRQKRPTPEGLTIRGQASPTYDPARRQVYLGFSDGTVMAVRPENGEIVWTIRLPEATPRFRDVDAKPALIDDGKGLFVAGYGQGVFRLDPDTGGIVYQRSLLSVTGAVRAEPLDVWVLSLGTREVVGFDVLQAQILWRTELEEGFPTAPVAAGHGEVFVGTSRGSTLLLDATDGRPLQALSPGSGASAPVYVQGEQAVMVSNKALVLVLLRGRGQNLSGPLPRDPGYPDFPPPR